MTHVTEVTRKGCHVEEQTFPALHGPMAPKNSGAISDLAISSSGTHLRQVAHDPSLRAGVAVNQGCAKHKRKLFLFTQGFFWGGG